MINQFLKDQFLRKLIQTFENSSLKKYYQDKVILKYFSNMHKETLDFGQYGLIKAYRIPNSRITAMLNEEDNFQAQRTLLLIAILIKFGHHDVE